MPNEVAVLLYPGCIFFEIALAVETLAEHLSVRYYTPDGQTHRASNGAHIEASGDFASLATARVAAVLIPGGDPRSIVSPELLAAPALRAQAERGALLAGICAGSLVLASAGLLKGRRATHNYTAEHASPEKVAATAAFWNGMDFERANLVQDGQTITAQPWAYRQFAAAVAKHLGVLGPEAAAALEGYVQHRTYGVA
jgi:transcriptional regulator GlxA family with amidase domain